MALFASEASNFLTSLTSFSSGSIYSDVANLATPLNKNTNKIEDNPNTVNESEDKIPPSNAPAKFPMFARIA